MPLKGKKKPPKKFGALMKGNCSQKEGGAGVQKDGALSADEMQHQNQNRTA